MNFQFTEEQLEIQALAKDFAEKKLAPTLVERDENSQFSRELFDEMGQLGFMGICFDEKYGGLGGDYLSYILALEEISKVDDGMGVAYSASVSLCASPILQFGTEEQREKWLTPLVTGEKMGAFALTEPNAGTDASSQETEAIKDGDSYIINGSKIFITNGFYAETYIVFAMTDKSRGTRGISAFIVDKDTPGFKFGKKEHKMGIKTSATYELIFQDMRVPAENMLGKEGEGFKIAMGTLDGGRIGIAAQALAIGEAALEYAKKYSKERKQFGKPIAAQQAVSFMIADMYAKSEASRLLVYQAACLKDAGKPYGLAAATAKMYASDRAMEITVDAVQILGGYGYSEEYPVARLMRNAKVTQIYEGTNQAQRMVIAGNILR